MIEYPEFFFLGMVGGLFAGVLTIISALINMAYLIPTLLIVLIFSMAGLIMDIINDNRQKTTLEDYY